jgi:hypothetical protein
MVQTAIHKTLAPVKGLLPVWLSNGVRCIATAFLTPVLYSYRTGHFLSSFRRVAVSRRGAPLPWYTYPSIDFLKYRNYSDKTILEFGGGQSTLWWAERARQVVTIEGNHDWYLQLKAQIPANVDLNCVSMENASVNTAQVREVLASKRPSKYDVIVIDGLYRDEMVDIAVSVLAEDGAIICDNAETYGFYDGFKKSGLNRVDFYGNAPGVILPHCTSIYFPSPSFVFNATTPIHVIADED